MALSGVLEADLEELRGVIVTSVSALKISEPWRSVGSALESSSVHAELWAKS